MDELGGVFDIEGNSGIENPGLARVAIFDE
jgi:hypothetical protein